MKKVTINFRAMCWADIIVYFFALKDKQDFTDKDLVDYFHFKTIDTMSLDRWTVPNYKQQTGCAKKVLSLYGKEFSLAIIDCLFENYKQLFNKSFSEISWSLGLLSSDRMGWLHSKLFELIKKQKSVDLKDEIERLIQNKDKWTVSDRERFLMLLKLINEGNNGEKA